MAKTKKVEVAPPQGEYSGKSAEEIKEEVELEEMIDELAEVLGTVGEEIVTSKCPNCGFIHNVKAPDYKPGFFSTQRPRPKV